MSDAEIHRSLGEIKGKLDSLISRHDARDSRDEAIEARVRKVEHRQHWWSGAGAIIGAVLGAVGVHIRGPV